MLVVITISLIVYIFFLKSGLVSVPNTNKIQTLGKHTIDKAQALKNFAIDKIYVLERLSTDKIQVLDENKKNIQTTDRGI